MKNKLICKLRGGLGNQMFQYAFARNIAYKYNLQLKFDIADKDFINSKKRIELDKVFEIDLEIASRQDYVDLMPFFFKYDFLRATLFRKRFKFLINFYPKQILVEKSLNFSSDYINKASKGCYLNGYWQSYKYLDSYEDVNKLFIWKDIKSACVQKFSDDIRKINKSASIHFRRSDYIQNDSILNYKRHYSFPLKSNYYLRCINYLRERNEDMKFFFFSDDIKFAYKFADTHKIDALVINNRKEIGLFDMFLMSICKNNVISNSTFSWWGAFLNKNKDKQVLAPSKWFSYEDKQYILNLFPEEWKIISYK